MDKACRCLPYRHTHVRGPVTASAMKEASQANVAVVVEEALKPDVQPDAPMSKRGRDTEKDIPDDRGSATKSETPGAWAYGRIERL